MIYKNYKINFKIFKCPMEKIAIILWNVQIHRNQIVFKKIQPNLFLVIEKATFNFQSLQEYVIDPQLQNKRRFVPQVVETLTCWIPPISGNFKLNFDGSRVENRSA